MKKLLIHSATNPDACLALRQACHWGRKAVSPEGLKMMGLSPSVLTLSIPRVNLENKPRCLPLGYTNVLILLLPIFFLGCITIKIPEQIKEEFIYKRVFKANLENSINAVIDSLDDLGWKVAYVSRSKLTKKDRTLDSEPKYQAYIFTKIKQIQLLLTSSYSTFNVRIEVIDDTQSEIALRYLSVTPIPPFYKQKINYKNDKLMERLYASIERHLSK